MKLVIALSLIIGSSVCFANRESGGRLGAAAVYADFRSTGNGIDEVALQKFEELYAESAGRGEVVATTTELTGREGELRRCVELQSATLSYQFIVALAVPILTDKNATGFQRTAVYSGVDCTSFNAATEQDLTRYP